MNYTAQITESEHTLLNAFKNKDLKTLAELIHDDSIFILPNGSMATKTMVLENYRSGDTVMTSILSSDQTINIIGDNAVVSVILTYQGKYFDQPINGKFRYIRVWKVIDEGWKVIAVSGIQLV